MMHYSVATARSRIRLDSAATFRDEGASCEESRLAGRHRPLELQRIAVAIECVQRR